METSEWLEFRGPEIFVGNHLEPIARLQLAHWVYAGERCSSVECREGLRLQFMENGQASGPSLGPFTQIHVREVHLFAGRQRAAKLSLSTGKWSRHGAEQSGSVVRVR